MKNRINEKFLNVRVKPMREIPLVEVVPFEMVKDKVDSIVGQTAFGHKIVLFDDGSMSFINDETNEVWNKSFKSVTDFTEGTAIVQDKDEVYHLATPTRYLFLSGEKYLIEQEKSNVADWCYSAPEDALIHFFEICEIATSKEYRNLAVEMLKVAVLTGKISIERAENLLNRITTITSRRSTKSKLVRTIDKLTNFQDSEVEESLLKIF